MSGHTPIRTMLLACAAAAAVAGCISPMGPDYQRPRAPVPAGWRVDVAHAEDITNTLWWRDFGDANLDRLISQALTANSDLLIAAARIDEYAARLETQHAAYFPQIGAEVDAQRLQRSEEVPEILRPSQPATYNQFTYGATLSYGLDLWGRFRRESEAARAELLSSEDARHAVMLSVVTAVANTYVELLARDQQLALARQRLESLKSTLQILEMKYRGGSETALDVEETRGEVEKQAALIPQLERSVGLLEDSLSTLTGVTPGSIARGDIGKLTFAPVPAGVPADVLLRRPDVLAAEQTLVAANARIGVAKTEYFPNLSLTGMYGQSSDSVQWLLAKTARTGMLEGSLIGPILTFGRVEGDVRQARAQTREATQQYLKTIRTALQEVNDALISNQDARLRATALQERVDTEKRAIEIARQGYKGGSYTYLDVLYTERQLYDAEDEEVQGRLDEYAALISIYQAMGGGWMTAVDRGLDSKLPAAAPPAAATEAGSP